MWTLFLDVDLNHFAWSRMCHLHDQCCDKKSNKYKTSGIQEIQVSIIRVNILNSPDKFHIKDIDVQRSLQL